MKLQSWVLFENPQRHTPTNFWTFLLMSPWYYIDLLRYYYPRCTLHWNWRVLHVPVGIHCMDRVSGYRFKLREGTSDLLIHYWTFLLTFPWYYIDSLTTGIITQDAPCIGIDECYTYQWVATAWTECQVIGSSCGKGLQTRDVTCGRNDGREAVAGIIFHSPFLLLC